MSDSSISPAATAPSDEAAEVLGGLITDGEVAPEPPLPVEEGPRRGLLIGLAALAGVALLWMLFRAVPDEASTSPPADRSRAEVERMADAAEPAWMQAVKPGGSQAGGGGIVPPPFNPHGSGNGEALAVDTAAGGVASGDGRGSGRGEEDPRREAFRTALRSRPVLAQFSTAGPSAASQAAENSAVPSLSAMEAEAIAQAIRRSEAASPGGALPGTGTGTGTGTVPGADLPAGAGSSPGTSAPAVLIGRSGGAGRGGLLLPAGTVIEGQLHTEVNSDLPGSVIGIVTRDVFDADQRVVVIPRHSWLVGTYESDVATGQVRLVVRWTSLRFPDGERFDLPLLRTGDPTGASGLPGRVNNHYGRIFGHALLTSFIGAGGILIDRSESGQNPSARGAVAEATAQQMLQTSSEVTRRNLAIKPTIVVPRLTRFSILLDRDLLFVRGAAGAGTGR
jgi:type IV secretory pathway VirB10-like protein